MKFTVGISDLFAKHQQSSNMTMLAQNVTCRLSLGISYTAGRAPFLGEVERKLRITSDLNIFWKNRESVTQQEKPFAREASFNFHGLLLMPLCMVDSAGTSKLLASLTGRNEEHLYTDLHSRSCCSSLGQDRSNGSAFPSLNQWDKWIKQELGKTNTGI